MSRLTKGPGPFFTHRTRH